MLILDKYNRSGFMEENNINNVVELDMITNKWNLFNPTRLGTYYTITDRDILRPDLISYLSYGKSNYWWIIAKVNNIDDWYNELVIGDVLFIPDRLDVEDFYIEATLSR
jgi:hypothetical protein